MDMKIKFKRTGDTGYVPATSIVDFGEIFINYADGVIYGKDEFNAIINLSGAPELHSHSISQVTGLQTALDSKLNSSSYTAADVKTKYESNSDTNAFTDALLTKLNGIASGAQVNVPTNLGITGTGNARTITSSTGANLLVNVANGGTAGFMSTEHVNKLAGIEAGATANDGTVTSVGMTVPTGLSVAGSPITGAGTLALTFASGYSIPTNAKQIQWDDAYNWGDHALAGYLAADGNGSSLTNLNASALTSGFVPTSVMGPTYPISTFTTGRSGTARTVFGLGEYHTTGTTGAILFTCPVAVNALMCQFDITVIRYNTQIGEMTVQGYKYLDSSWLSTMKISNGSTDYPVRFGISADNKPVIIIGDVDTVWAHTQISITQAFFNYTGASDAICQEWVSSRVTDLSSYIGVTGFLPQTTTVTRATSAASLITPRTLTIGDTGKTFDGSANVSWTLAEIGADTNLSISGTGNSITLNSSTGTGTSVPVATQSNAGLMSTTDKAKVDGISPTDVSNWNTAYNKRVSSLAFTGTTTKTLTLTLGDGTTVTGNFADNNTTYSIASLAELQTGTATTDRTISALRLKEWADWRLSGIGGGSSYTAGNGISIVGDEISLATTIAGGPYTFTGDVEAANSVPDEAICTGYISFTGSPVTIHDSFGCITAVTRIQAGVWDLTLTGLVNGNYAVGGWARSTGTNAAICTQNSDAAASSTNLRIYVRNNGGTAIDSTKVCVLIFGGK